MKLKKTCIFALICFLAGMTSCGGGKENNSKDDESSQDEAYEMVESSESYSLDNSDNYGSDNDMNDNEDEESPSVSSSSSSVSSSDFDEFLKSYEEYIDKYISLMKKAKDGDMAALAEYPALLQKAQEFGDKLESSKGDLTPSQVAKFTKLQNKLLKAAQDL